MRSKASVTRFQDELYPYAEPRVLNSIKAYYEMQSRTVIAVCMCSSRRGLVRSLQWALLFRSPLLWQVVVHGLSTRLL